MPYVKLETLISHLTCMPITLQPDLIGREAITKMAHEFYKTFYNLPDDVYHNFLVNACASYDLLQHNRGYVLDILLDNLTEEAYRDLCKIFDLSDWYMDCYTNEGFIKISRTQWALDFLSSDPSKEEFTEQENRLQSDFHDGIVKTVQFMYNYVNHEHSLPERVEFFPMPEEDRPDLKSVALKFYETEERFQQAFRKYQAKVKLENMTEEQRDRLLKSVYKKINRKNEND